MIEEREQQQNLTACAEVLASLKFDKNLIKQFLREELMRESPIYQEILQTGVQQGVQQGLRQGKCDTVIRQLTRRLSTVQPELQTQIHQLSVAQLDELSEALLDFSTESDLVTWLQTH